MFKYTWRVHPPKLTVEIRWLLRNTMTFPVTNAALPYNLWHKRYHRMHDDVIKWKHFPRYWPFVWGIHRSPVNSPHEGQWRGALMFSLVCAWTNGWVNNRDGGDLRRHRTNYDVTVMTRKVISTHVNEIPRKLILDITITVFGIGFQQHPFRLTFLGTTECFVACLDYPHRSV